MKVALIAISSTAIRDPFAVELIKASLSLQARLAAVASLPSLALLTVAAVIGDAAEVSYFQCPSVDAWTELPLGFDLVGISSYTAQIHEAYALADRYKAAGVPVVIGGPHVSMLPFETTSRGHTACIGEAEVTWPQIISDAKAGKLAPVYGKLLEACDLTKSPIPRFDLLETNSFNRIPIQTSRGCPHRCEFCAASVLLSPKQRQKTVSQVLAEIDRVLELWYRPFIEFVDDNALFDRKFWKPFLSELTSRKVRWFAECDISIGQDQELLSLMKKSGCREVLIGLESPGGGELDGMELNNNWKHRAQANYLESVKRIQQSGIRVIGCFMLALDSQTAISAERILEFVEQSDLFDVQITLQTAFPGTPLYARLAGNDRLKVESDWSNCTLFDLNVIPENTSEQEVQSAFRELISKIHRPESVLQRRARFKAMIRGAKQVPNRSVMSTIQRATVRTER